MSSNPELFGDRPAINYGSISTVGTHFAERDEEEKILPLYAKRKTTKRSFKGSTRLIYRNRKRIIRRFTQLVIFLVLVYSVFSVYTFYLFKREPFCTSEYCHRAESEILKSTDFEVNPCQNFYKFACGNWYKHHVIPPHATETSVVQMVQQKMMIKVSQYLSQTDSRWEPKIIHEIRKFYQSCMKTGISTLSKEYADFVEVGEVLTQVGLPLAQHIMNTSPGFSWPRVVALSKKLFDRNFFFEFDVVKDPRNHAHNRILISKPITTSMFSSMVNVRNPYTFVDPVNDFNKVSEMLDQADVKELARNAYHKFIRSVYKLAYEAASKHWTLHTEKEFNMMFVLLILFSSNLDQTMKHYTNDKRHTPKLYTIDSLQQKTDAIFQQYKHPLSINWKDFLVVMFRDTNVTLDFQYKDKAILISHEEYLFSVLTILAKTPPYAIESYLWWETIHGTMTYTNSKLNEFADEFSHKISGLPNKPRELFCAEMTNHLYGFAAAHFLVNDKSIKQKSIKVGEIVDNIQSELANTITNLDWLDNSTKTKALRKLNSLTKEIGYPEWMESSYNLDKYYENTTCSADNFLGNVVSLKRKQMKMKLTFLRLRNNFSNEGWYSKFIMHTNAFYVMEKNSMVIPAGLFPYPFYDLGLEALNYGAIGMIIGHELTHGFDNTGKEFDEFGRLRKWWSKNTEKEFEKRAQCFIDEYNKFSQGVIRLRNMQNGSITLNENIADNGGLQLAYYAYKNYVKRHGPESLLPRVKYFTSDQLFFLSFAHTWCEFKQRERFEVNSDEPHSPYAIRVIGSLKNFPEFAKAWGCKKGSPMNPGRKRCQLW